MRPSGRALVDMRKIEIQTNVNAHAEGSCLIKVGQTHVLCTATVEETVPLFMRKSGLGWVTGEYGMLPRSTHSRIKRESVAGKPSGRTQEISRLIGRSLRAAVDRTVMGERQITVDCDVLQADGGTRCAAITGGWIAMRLAFNQLLRQKILTIDPIIHQIAAVSVGVYAGQEILDLDYAEDSEAGMDSNFVMASGGQLIEIQATAEGGTFDRAQFERLHTLAEKGIRELIVAQNQAIS